MVREVLQEAVLKKEATSTRVSVESVQPPLSLQVGSFSKLKVAELREKLSEQGLSTGGTKPILVARLKEALQGCSSSPSIVGTPTKAEDTPGTPRRSESLSENQAEPTRPSSPVKIKLETGRASTPVRRTRRLSGSLECPTIETPVQEKISIEAIDTIETIETIETITEDTEEQQAGETPAADTELEVIKEQSQPKEAPAKKPEVKVKKVKEKSEKENEVKEKPEKENEVKEKPEKENIPLEKRLDQLFASKSIPRQKPKSGRFWKGERAQFRQIKRDRGQRPTFEQRLKMKEEKARNQELAELMKNRKKQEKEELRKRIEENKTKKLENERKTEQYQLVKNPAKIKRMKKKQLRMLEKRDILPTK